jgi:NitT/TauT family transport system substrate-binding protein
MKLDRQTSAILLAAASAFWVNLEIFDAASAETITIAETGSGSADGWPVFGAVARGYFKENGIELDFISTSSSASGLQQLAAGSVDISTNGLADPLRAIDKGAPVTLLRLEVMQAPYQVYAKPNIHSFADLKGKEVMLGGIKDVTRIYFDRMATPNGLTKDSYDLVYAGTTAARLSALFSGSIDATILSPPYNFKAQTAKFSHLPAPPDFSRGIPFDGFSVNTNWAKRHQQLIGKFLSAYAKGVAWFHDPANREEAVDILVKHTSIDRSEVEKTYDFYIGLKAFNQVGGISNDDLGTLLDVLKAQGDIEGSTELSRFYNPDALGIER